MSEAKREAEIRRIFCNACRQVTNHELISRHSRTEDLGDEESGNEIYTLHYEIWKCRGCESMTFRHHEINDFIADVSSDAGFNYDVKETLYPRRIRHIAKFFFNIPQRLRQIYNETVECFNAGNWLLCGAGIRATIEGICLDKVIVEGPTSKGKIERNLEGRLNALSKFIPESIVSNLHGLRFLGNDVVHELKVPKEEDLELALEIVEDMLNVLYNLDYRSKLIAEKYRGRIAHPKSPAGSGISDGTAALKTEVMEKGEEERQAQGTNAFEENEK